MMLQSNKHNSFIMKTENEAPHPAIYWRKLVMFCGVKRRLDRTYPGNDVTGMWRKKKTHWPITSESWCDVTCLSLVRGKERIHTCCRSVDQKVVFAVYGWVAAKQCHPPCYRASPLSSKPEFLRIMTPLSGEVTGTTTICVAKVGKENETCSLVMVWSSRCRCPLSLVEGRGGRTAAVVIIETVA